MPRCFMAKKLKYPYQQWKQRQRLPSTEDAINDLEDAFCTNDEGRTESPVECGPGAKLKRVSLPELILGPGSPPDSTGLRSDDGDSSDFNQHDVEEEEEEEEDAVGDEVAGDQNDLKPTVDGSSAAQLQAHDLSIKTEAKDDSPSDGGDQAPPVVAAVNTGETLIFRPYCLRDPTEYNYAKPELVVPVITIASPSSSSSPSLPAVSGSSDARQPSRPGPICRPVLSIPKPAASADFFRLKAAGVSATPSSAFTTLSSVCQATATTTVSAGYPHNLLQHRNPEDLSTAQAILDLSSPHRAAGLPSSTNVNVPSIVRSSSASPVGFRMAAQSAIAALSPCPPEVVATVPSGRHQLPPCVEFVQLHPVISYPAPVLSTVNTNQNHPAGPALVTPTPIILTPISQPAVSLDFGTNGPSAIGNVNVYPVDNRFKSQENGNAVVNQPPSAVQQTTEIKAGGQVGEIVEKANPQPPSTAVGATSLPLAVQNSQAIETDLIGGAPVFKLNGGKTTAYTYEAFFASDGRSKKSNNNFSGASQNSGSTAGPATSSTSAKSCDPNVSGGTAAANNGLLHALGVTADPPNSNNSTNGSANGHSSNNNNNNKSKYMCTECGKYYATSSNLSRHRQTHRTLDSSNAKQCHICNKMYVSMPALSMHVLTHSLNHRCNICGKAFSRPWLLQGHLRSHTGDKPYGCAHCGKSFADRSNLRAHMQTHSAFKNYKCKRCHKSFALKSYLNKHFESACYKEIPSSTPESNSSTAMVIDTPPTTPSPSESSDDGNSNSSCEPTMLGQATADPGEQFGSNPSSASPGSGQQLPVQTEAAQPGGQSNLSTPLSGSPVSETSNTTTTSHVIHIPKPIFPYSRHLIKV